jgi:hypothetical protein
VAAFGMLGGRMGRSRFQPGSAGRAGEKFACGSLALVHRDRIVDGIAGTFCYGERYPRIAYGAESLEEIGNSLYRVVVPVALGWYGIVSWQSEPMLAVLTNPQSMEPAIAIVQICLP